MKGSSRAIFTPFLALTALPFLAGCDSGASNFNQIAAVEPEPEPAKAPYNPCGEDAVQIAKQIIAERLKLELDEFDISSTSINGSDETIRKFFCIGLFDLGTNPSMPINFTVQPTADGSDVLIFVNISPEMAAAAYSHTYVRRIEALAGKLGAIENARAQRAEEAQTVAPSQDHETDVPSLETDPEYAPQNEINQNPQYIENTNEFIESWP